MIGLISVRYSTVSERLKMSAQIETIVNAYKTLSKIPSVAGGKLNAAGNKVTGTWSVRNLDKGHNSKYQYNYTLDSELKVIAQSDFGTDVSNELLSSVSPAEDFRAVIREEKVKDSKKQYLEVWSRSTLRHCVDLNALDIHGDVYADSEFGSLSWSPDASALVYIAEKKRPKTEPYIKRKKEDKTKADGSGEPVPKKGAEFVYRQDWGEQLVGKYLSVIVVFRLQTESFTILEGLPECWCPGQVRVTEDGLGVVGVAWSTEPRRLGLIFCTNRPGFIFTLTFDGIMTKITAEGYSVRSVRLSPNGDLVWLQRTVGGPHHACHELVILKKGSTTPSTLIGVVDTEVQTANGCRFHGIYSQSLPARCFSVDGKRIVFSTPQQNETRAYAVDIALPVVGLMILTDSGSLVDISGNFPRSTSVLDVSNDVILAVCSNLTTPNQLEVARLPQGVEGASWVTVSTAEEGEALQTLKSSTTEYLLLEHKDSEDSVKSFSAIYLAPPVSADHKLPLIVWPHGGPHSNFVNAYSFEAAFFNMLGFATLQINYRGSTGAGQASVGFLPKRVGDADVKDCKLATDVALQKYPYLNDQAVCLSGGSHGGFLVTHLSGQYPDTYKVVVTRNPVTDVASMFNSTDIADWCAVEAGFVFTERGQLSEEQLLAMRRCSPLVHAHRVKAPTALLLGQVDKRVPYYQGLEYARRLKANGVPTRIYMYDDNHSLSSQPAEMDSIINAADWFLQHLSL